MNRLRILPLLAPLLLAGTTAAAAQTALRPAPADAPSSALAARASAFVPPVVDNQAITLGVGYTTGGVGVEWLRRAPLDGDGGPLDLGVGLGGGAGGAGLRLELLYANGENWTFDWSPYASMGIGLSPWRPGPLDATGVWGGEVGVQHWGADGGWFYEAGVGAARTFDGEWAGLRTLPVVRLAVGRGV